MVSSKPDAPLKYLRSAMNRVVLVKLKDGSEYIGKLELSDNTMNLILSDCIEVHEGSDEPKTKYGRVFIRGSNILFVSLDYHQVKQL